MNRPVFLNSMHRGLCRTAQSLLIVVLAAWSQGVLALGLGDIEVRSFLGQPLEARIALLSRSPDEFEGISARLASADSFQLVGLDRMALSVPLQFVVHPEAEGAYVAVRSLDPVTDPVLQFVVEVAFANGRLLRQYTVFLDPPTVAAPVPLPSIAPRSPARTVVPEPEDIVPAETQEMSVATAAEGPSAKPPPPPERDGTPVEPSEPPEASEPSAPAEIADSQQEEGPAPAAETDAVERVPAEEEAGEAPQAAGGAPDESPAVDTSGAPVEDVRPAGSDIEQDDVVATQTQEPEDSTPDAADSEDLSEASPVRPTAYQVTQGQLESYGPVQRGQTLWGIATEVSANTGFSVNQVMLAIQRYNPDAFGNDNINLLKSGSILRLPPASEIDRMTAREAMLESMRQADDYADILAGRTPERRPAPILAAPGESSNETDPVEVMSPGGDDGRLELIPPEETPRNDGAVTGPGASGLDETRPDASQEGDASLLSEEERDVAAQESKHLSERLQELKEELGETAAAVPVEDKGMAEMEQRLREQRAAPASAPPPVEAPAGGLSAYLPWLLLALLLLVAGGVVWWFRRRGLTGPSEAPAAVDHGATPAETARAMAGEAEEILRTLEGGDDDGPEAVESERRPEAGAPVIDLEDYIGHLERDSAPGKDEEAIPPQESAASDEVEAPKPDDSVPFWEEGEVAGDGDEPEPGSEDGDAVESEATDPETKLDLARAYISMGDKPAARELLEEVLRDGDEAQVAEARSMMDET